MDLKKFKNMQFCRAGGALSNHVKISKKKNLVDFCITATLFKKQHLILFRQLFYKNSKSGNNFIFIKI